MKLLDRILQKIRIFSRLEEIIKAYTFQTISIIKNQEYERIRYDLNSKAVHCSRSGISNSKLCDKEVIVSLTSYGERIYDVCLAIESIMQGTMLPNRIVLWLSEVEFKDKTLPITLQNQKRRGLEIRYTADIKSYKKLIPSLKEFPESVIITIDDDAMYNYDFVENLVNSYRSNPMAIHANRISQISYLEDGSIESYLKWKSVIGNNIKDSLSYLFTGVGGVLYPPHSLDASVFDEKAFMSLCKYGDDVWFSAMAIKKGTKVHKSYTHDLRGVEYIAIQNNRSDSLCIDNNNPENCRNDIQIKAVYERFQIIEILRESE